jgi:uncharacterized protein (TIGR03437 family)
MISTKTIISRGLMCAWAAALWAQAPPAVNPGGTVNAASDTAPVAPGSIASVYGVFPVETAAQADSLPLPGSLGGLSLAFGSGTPAPLFYASGLQVNVQVPWELAGQAQTTVTVTAGGQTSMAQTVALAPFAPAIFSMNGRGSGQGAILDSAYRLVDASNPAIPGSTYLLIYCTGLGAVTNQPASGAAAPSSPLAETTTTPTVTVGGVAATVSFSGLAPGAVGLYQVNVLVPAGVPAGAAVPVQISMEGTLSNTVTVAVGAAGTGQSMITAAGGITEQNMVVPLQFSWNTPLQVSGAGWMPGESITIALHGPLNWPAAPAADLALGTLAADASGKLSGSLTIPYDNGLVGPSARIPRPGVYQVSASGAASGTVVSSGLINLCVTTASPGAPLDWGTARGGRVGVFPGSLADYSPERTDPEWVTVWHGTPVSAYGTITDSHISDSDYPGSHYAHDANFFLSPDPAYAWLVGTANYSANAGEQGSAPPGIIEIEWETLNGGNTNSYGEGTIGIPLWAHPTVGDRVFVVGRWVLDAGHPDNGDSTEIHPPRLLATLRERPAAMPGNGARAAQVDVYVSGHGGGANQDLPPGLTDLLDQQGWGGGRIQDVLDTAGQQLYYGAGPAPANIAALAAALVLEMTGEPLTGPINSAAGPSAFPWGAPGTEEMPINDMDYDFDVPLPPPPPGATAVQMQSITHPQHSTTVNEMVTYTNLVNGLPTVAHIHLPYLGADNGIYARTLLFAWNQASSPGTHFRVGITGITPNDNAGPWQMWSDVSGQWDYLTGLAPALLNTQTGAAISIPGVSHDVYLQSSDSLRVYVQGYHAMCIDSLFGNLFGQTSYMAGTNLIGTCGTTDNVGLGEAVLTLPAAASSAGQYTVSGSGGHFQVQISVEAVE